MILSSFDTTDNKWPFQNKNDVILNRFNLLLKIIYKFFFFIFFKKNPRKTFIDRIKNKPKESWPPDTAKWSFKN
jgi:hypothetical protein